MDPSLGWIHLLEWLTEHRETFHLLDYQFIIEWNNSETTRSDQQSKVWGKDIPTPMFPSALPLAISIYSPTQSSLNPIFWDFYRGHNIVMVD